MTSDSSFLGEPPQGPAVAEAYEADLASDGYVNNLTRVWCWRPDVLTSFQDLRDSLLTDSSLSPEEVAAMVAATAASLGDAYCALAWGARLAGLVGEDAAAEVLEGRDPGLSARVRALVSWCRGVVMDPNATTRGDVTRLREAGFTDKEIFEATAWIAFRMAFSTVNDALGAAPDRELVAKTSARIRDAVTFGRRPPAE
jgi:alkylhydroperoxidase family enzyme